MTNEDFDWIRKDLALNLDMLGSILGKEIGEGYSRKVFEHRQDSSLVIKLATCSEGVLSNCTEATLWLDHIVYLRGNLEWVKNWFAPVTYVSPNYNVLIMKKTEQKPHKKRPSEVPNFMSDVKSDNFGWIGNKFVCHDYGFISGFLNYKNKFKKVSHMWH